MISSVAFQITFFFFNLITSMVITFHGERKCVTASALMLTVVKRSIATVGHSYEGFLIDHFSCLQKNHNLLLLSSVNNHQYLFHLLICTIDPLITKKILMRKQILFDDSFFFFLPIL